MFSTSLQFISVLAQQTAPWQRLGDRFSSNREVSWETWVGLAVPFVLIIAVLLLAKFWMGRHQRGQDSPWGLFRELAAAHRLSLVERWLLARLAKASGVDHPVHVFLDAALYEDPRIARRLSLFWPEIERLRGQLFEHPPQSAGPAEAADPSTG